MVRKRSIENSSPHNFLLSSFNKRFSDDLDPTASQSKWLELKIRKVRDRCELTRKLQLQSRAEQAPTTGDEKGEKDGLPVKLLDPGKDPRFPRRNKAYYFARRKLKP